MIRLITMFAFTVAAGMVTLAALLVFGLPVKESRVLVALLVLAPAVAAGGVAGLMVLPPRTYRMGFVRGAVVGMASLLVFSLTMASLGCSAGAWSDCLHKALTAFGFVMGVPVVVVSGLVGMLLEEIYAP